MRLILKAALSVVLLLVAAGFAWQAGAQSYPTRPVRIIATSTAGGPQDVLMRFLANHLSTKLGQPFVVENRVGGNTIIAAQAVWEAPADGAMLLVGSDATFSINPNLHKRLAYDGDGFVPIALLISVEQQLYVNASLPVNSLAEFIAYAKARPGQLNYSSIGVGSTPHLASERFKQATGVEMVHVPFRGAPESLAALAADQVQMSIIALTAALPLLQSGKVKALATGGSKHFPELPGVPTFIEAGYPQLDFKVWFGLMAKKGTPQPIIDLLADESIKYVTSDQFRNVVAPRNRWTVLAWPQQQSEEFLKQDRAIYRRAIEYAKLPIMD